MQVLACDQDTQGSISEMLGVYTDEGNRVVKSDILKMDLYNLYMKDADVHKYIRKTRYSNIDIIPNARNIIEDASFELAFNFYREDEQVKVLAFRKNLEKIMNEYDFIVIDGQPSNGRMTDILLMASDYVLTPVCPDMVNVSPITEIIAKINYLNARYNRDVCFAGFIFNRVGKNDDSFIEMLKADLPEMAIETKIREAHDVVKNAASDGKMFVEYKRYSNPAKDIIALMVDGLGVIDEEHYKILNDNIDNRNFGRIYE